MTTTTRVIKTSVYAMMFDPSEPDRPQGFHLDTIDEVTFPDGTKTFRNPRQHNAAGAKALGIELDGILSGLNIESLTRADTAAIRADAAEARAMEAEGEAKATNEAFKVAQTTFQNAMEAATAENANLRRLLIEAAQEIVTPAPSEG